MVQVNHTVDENLWYDEKCVSIRGRRTRRSRSRNSSVKLINDHNISEMASKITRLSRQKSARYTPAEPFYEMPVPAVSKWDSCLLCLELTGTHEYFDENYDLAAYHTKAKYATGSSLPFLIPDVDDPPRHGVKS